MIGILFPGDEIENELENYEIEHSERSEILEKAMNSDTLEIPVTNYIESKTKVHSVELKDFEPSFHTLEDLLKLIKTDHLSTMASKIFKEGCKTYYDVFSKFIWDTGLAKSVSAYVEMTTNKQYTQRYYPIPIKARDEVGKILKNMLDLNIIRYSTDDDKEQFINCLMITKRKNNKIRLILDNRLCNAHSKTIEAQYPTNLEILANIPKNVKYITSLDLAISFHSIPIERSSQHAFSFYNEKKKKCYIHAYQMGTKTLRTFYKRFFK